MARLRFCACFSLCFLALLFAAFTVPATAQSNLNPADQGIQPFGSYHGGDIDVVELLNGKLDLHAPLLSYPQRGGKLPMSFTLRYDNPAPWILRVCIQGVNCTYSWIWEGEGVRVLPDFHFGFCCGKVVNGVSSGSLMLADGSTHEFAFKQGTTISETLDGSGLWMDSSDNVIDRQGVRYYANGNMEDPNGNMITATSSGWTDILGRSIPTPPTATSGVTTTNTSSCTGPLPIVKAYTWTVPGPNSTNAVYTFCYVTLSVTLPAEYGAAQTTKGVTVLQSLVLPNSQAWTFQ